MAKILKSQKIPIFFFFLPKMWIHRNFHTALMKCKLVQLFWKPVCCSCCSVAKSCPNLRNTWTAACQASLSFTIFQSLPKFTFTESVMLSNHLILSIEFMCSFLITHKFYTEEISSRGVNRFFLEETYTNTHSNSHNRPS